MKYRTIGHSGKSVSALGFGAMRLPTRGHESQIDEPAAVEMLRYAIDQGVNYVDTAYVYHGGHSETVVGRALEDGYRAKVHLATKLPIWQVEKRTDFDRFLNQQLARLRTNHVDFYLLHCLQKNSWPRMRDLDVCAWAQRAQADGRIGEFGFSFHDSFDVFQTIVDDYDWSFCQIQYNLVCQDVQAGSQGLRYAAEKGLGVIIMEPLFGGALASPPQSVWEIWQASGRKPADMALRWLWDKREVSLVLSGMSTLEQVRENVESAQRSGVGWFEKDEQELVGRVQEEYAKLSPIPCTKCGYCMPCPHGVNIPANLELYNNATVFKGNSVTLCRNLYHALPESEQAKACQECGTCESLCPQGIEVGQVLERVASYFS